MSVAPRDDRWLRPSREIRRYARLLGSVTVIINY